MWFDSFSHLYFHAILEPKHLRGENCVNHFSKLLVQTARRKPTLVAATACTRSRRPRTWRVETPLAPTTRPRRSTGAPQSQTIIKRNKKVYADIMFFACFAWDLHALNVLRRPTGYAKRLEYLFIYIYIYIYICLYKWTLSLDLSLDRVLQTSLHTWTRLRLNRKKQKICHPIWEIGEDV